MLAVSEAVNAAPATPAISIGYFATQSVIHYVRKTIEYFAEGDWQCLHDIALGALAARITLRTRTVFAKAAQPGTPVNFELPVGACDCHTHIIGDPEKIPFVSGRVYTP